ncbi:MAG: WD40 repeat domain-containing protein [Chitinophagaceae bacterium]
MNRFLAFLFSMLMLTTANGQHNYAEAVVQGDKAFKTGQYIMAINKYFAAEAFDPAKKKEIKEKVSRVFTRIEKLRTEAEIAKKQAVTEKNNAIAAKKEVSNSNDAFRLVLMAKEKAKEDPTVALRIAEAALQKHHDKLILDAAVDIFRNNEFYATQVLDRKLTRPLRCAAISPDGTTIATGSDDGIVRLWTAGCRLIKEFTLFHQPVMSLAFAPNGKSLLAGGYDYSTVLWTLNDSVKKIYKANRSVVGAVAFSPDGTKFVTGAYNGKAMLWETFTGSQVPLKEFAMSSGIYSIAFSKDGATILLGTQAESALWNVADSTKKDLGIKVTGVLASARGNPVIIGRKGEKKGLYDWQENELMQFRAEPGKITCSAFLLGEKKCITGAEDGTIILWDKYGEPKKEFKMETRSSITSIVISEKADGFFSWSKDNKVRYWPLSKELENEFALQGDSGNIVAAIFSPDQKKILTVNDKQVPQLWNINGTMLHRFDTLVNYTDGPLNFSPDGNGIIVHFKDSLTMLLSLQGQQLAAATGACVGFSPDGKNMITCDANGMVSLLNNGGKLISVLKPADNSKVVYTAISPYDGKMLAGTNSASIVLWNKDSRYDQTINVNDSSGAIGGFLKKGPGIVQLATFSPDKKTILVEIAVPVSRGHINRNLLVNTKTGAQININGHNIVFSADGSRILYLLNNAVIIQNAAGDILSEYKLPEGELSEIARAAFSLEAGKIITISTNGIIRIWKQLQDLETFLKSSQLDMLTPEQKKEFGID